MANFTPITVTADNYEEAINENIRRIFQTLEGKVYDADVENLLADLDAGDNKLVNAPVATDNYQPITKVQLDAV